ncbi:IS1634 family transposase [uncultured Desulfobacter sp.]|uniref:IS1634 family transposase n=1 Tax=uncultured Desulfobacter sp. TaxID=240139 RepID=UPI0029F5487F|nr:IS1634 family transposase [uncultured Desulfobacter sp.]
MQIPSTEEWKFTDVRFFPIFREYAKRLNIVETINTMVDSNMDLSPGDAALAMIMDTLSGRTPLYRLEEAFNGLDSELILGVPISPDQLNDNNLGRAMDKLFEAGTNKIFSQISQNAIGCFKLDTGNHHFDTTSFSVYGDYDHPGADLKITYGYSKDKRPDLKQFMVSMLCVDRNIPIIGKTQDGNSSDKTLNNELLSNISAHLAQYGFTPGASIYVADSAFVTAANLAEAERNNLRFLSRLPANFNECKNAISRAVSADEWQDIGELAESKSVKRPAAAYRSFDTTVTIEDTAYRAIVFHSSSNDKRRQKRVDRMLKSSHDKLKKIVKESIPQSFKCRPDAQRTCGILNQSAGKSLHKIKTEVVEAPKYDRGRPQKGKERQPKHIEYEVNVTIEEDPAKVEKLRLEAGCFVLITNVPAQDHEKAWTGEKLLRLYKEQDGIEKNFGFLKDPAIVNAIFLKKPERVEALGLILLLSLLLWRLVERDLKLYVKNTGNLLPGWDKRMTKSPTAFMMTTKFLNVLVITAGKQRQLAKPLNDIQLQYIKALGISQKCFSEP